MTPTQSSSSTEKNLSGASGRSVRCGFLDKFNSTESFLVGEGKDIGTVLFHILPSFKMRLQSSALLR